MTRCGHCGQEHPAGTAVCPVTHDSLAAPGLIGQRLDRYLVEGLLGAGGFGAVYRAVHQHTDARVALKVLKPTVSSDPTIVERFLREAKAAAAVGSEHIVRVLDAGVAQPSGQAFLAMELLDGCDLRELAHRSGPLAPTRLVLIVGQVLDGLGAAHGKGIVHRDMKPANVFVSRRVDEQGVERDVIRLLDFGISKMHGDGATSGLTVTGMAMGTPSYMAPEQFFDARNVDARADLYSVAVMLYELLSGRLPFEADSYAALIVKVKTEAPPPLLQVSPTLPPALAQAIMVGLAKEKEKRWASALEFQHALRAALGLPARNVPAPSAPVPPGVPCAPAPGMDTPSMLHGKTSAPVRAQVTPFSAAQPHSQTAPPAGLSHPAAPASTSGPPGAPAPVPAPSALPPMPLAPPAALHGSAPPAPAAPAPPGRTSATKVLLIVLGVIGLLTGCCVCTAVIGAAGQANDDPSQQPDGPMPGGRRPPRRPPPAPAVDAPEAEAPTAPAPPDLPPANMPLDEALEAEAERVAEEAAKAVEGATKAVDEVVPKEERPRRRRR